MSTSRALELRIMQMYIWALATPKYVEGRRAASLARHGAFEVRLIEFPTSLKGADFPLWVELFDHTSQTSLDSHGGYDFEEAAQVAEKLVSRAKELFAKYDSDQTGRARI
jgi:hypothetical protein